MDRPCAAPWRATRATTIRPRRAPASTPAPRLSVLVGTLSGYVNDFSVHGNDLNNVSAEAVMAAERSGNGELTWYISCDQVYPQPNYFIDANNKAVLLPLNALDREQS